MGDVSVEVSARPETSKFDLNAAGPAILQRYFLIAGASKKGAEAIAAAIELRREKFTETRKFSSVPGRPFSTISQLFEIGADDDFVECTGPELTVFTGRVEVEGAQASDSVREAIGYETAGVPTSAISAGAVVPRAIGAGELFEVTFHALDSETKRSISRQTIVRVTGNPRGPLWVVSDRAPAPGGESMTAACRRLRARQSS